MKTLITAIALGLTSNVVLADGFAPWDDRNVAADNAVVTQAEVAPAGFAPWRDIERQPQSVSTDVRFSDVNSSAFRPWS